jgi:NAD(P)-dependent dehydrogenase (short-subunit alcohol dehydrogenase family)
VSSTPMMELFRLDGEVAVVTGGHGRLGSQYARALAAAGAAVAVVDRVPQPHPRVHELIASGAPASTHTVDVSDRAAMDVTIDRIARRFGTPTILINNAGLGASPADAARDRRVRALWMGERGWRGCGGLRTRVLLTAKWP